MDNVEISEKIAVEIMGQYISDSPYGLAINTKDPYKGGKFIKFLNTFNPPENIAQAFEVRDKIARMRFSVRMKFKDALQQIISDRLQPHDVGPGSVRFLMDMEEIIIHVNANDICLAALEAVK